MRNWAKGTEKEDVLFSCSSTKTPRVRRLKTMLFVIVCNAVTQFKPLAGKITSHISNICLHKSHVVLLCRKSPTAQNMPKNFTGHQRR